MAGNVDRSGVGGQGSMSVLKRLWESGFWGNRLEAYAGFLIILLLTLLIAYLTDRFLKKKLFEWADKTKTEIDDFIVKRVFPPVVYIIVILGLAVAKRCLHLPAELGGWTDKILFALGLAVVFLLLIRLAKGIINIAAHAYCRRLELQQVDDLKRQIQTAERIRKQLTEIVSMVMAILAILTILSNLGVNLKAIWASLGIGGIALALAVKEPLTNLVGRMYIYGTGLFDEGHFIVFGKWAGTVTRISVFRTYFQLFADMTTVSVPNAEFVKGVVRNFYGRTRFMYKWDLSLPYDLPADKVQDMVVRLRDLVASHPEVNPDICWIYLERPDSYAKIVRVWFQALLPDWSTSLFYGHKVLQEIRLLFEREGVALPFRLRPWNSEPITFRQHYRKNRRSCFRTRRNDVLRFFSETLRMRLFRVTAAQGS
jgi:MscS family membrane protein